MVYNIVEKAKLVNVPSPKPYYKAMFSFRGMLIPLMDIRKILGLSTEPENLNNCVLIVEIKINESIELVGIPIDEVLEISEIDDLLTYNYHPFQIGQKCDLNESIVLCNGDPVVVINANKISKSKLLFEKEMLHPLNLLGN